MIAGTNPEMFDGLREQSREKISDRLGRIGSGHNPRNVCVLTNFELISPL